VEGRIIMWGIALALLFQAGDAESPIKGDEEVILFPTYAHLDEDGAAWAIEVRGWIYEPERDSLARRLILGQFRRALGLDGEGPESATFEERARAFLVDNERGKAIPVRVGEDIVLAGPSGANGHFAGSLRIPAERAKGLADGHGWIATRAMTREGDDRAFAGKVRLIGKEGISVISDIDDTIKVSEVADRKALLANTFLREFRAVPGMADAYRAWAEEGAAFHYASASPWQLYGPLSAFIRDADFPEGSMHLKDFRWKDASFFNLFASPEETKRRAIIPILEAFPARRFILVGDSGEADPEIYAALAREHPEQVAQIYIRDVSGPDADPGRFSEAFKGLPADRWKVFRDPAELKAD
jgi:phosphatidate phosphatase APP1